MTLWHKFRLRFWGFEPPYPPWRSDPVLADAEKMMFATTSHAECERRLLACHKMDGELSRVEWHWTSPEHRRGFLGDILRGTRGVGR